MLKTFCQDQDQDRDFRFQDQDKTCVFVLEAPRDQDLGLEDYITAIQSVIIRERGLSHRPRGRAPTCY